MYGVPNNTFQLGILFIDSLSLSLSYENIVNANMYVSVIEYKIYTVVFYIYILHIFTIDHLSVDKYLKQAGICSGEC